MSLPSLELDAFLTVASHLNFTQAANSLCITQSALSQRIAKLEQKVGHLFTRNTKTVSLTSAGHQLLRYCLKKDALEKECLEQISTKNNSGSCGIIRIGGISTALRFVVLPAFSQLLRENINVKLELVELEIKELVGALETNRVDFIVSTRCINNKFMEVIPIGVETYVLLECANQPVQQDVYLDHDIEDEITHLFLEQQDEKSLAWRQHYLDNIHLIIEATKLGIGRAVLPYQVLEQESGLKEVHNQKPLTIPLYLMSYKQEHHTHLQQMIINTLTNRV